jgi:flagellar hook-basal body complex protein FliE
MSQIWLLCIVRSVWHICFKREFGQALENDMDKVNKELKVSRAAVAKGELEAKDLERLCKHQ